MLVLVANLGSTSFKFKLFDMSANEAVVARGAADRIGDPPSSWSLTVGDADDEGAVDLADHGQAISLFTEKLAGRGIDTATGLAAIGFKAVHGGPIRGAVVVDDEVLTTMQQFADVAPAHNPPYIAAMKAFARKLPGVPQVAAFETAFHQTIPAARQVYAIPHEWTEMGVRRFGFHGASHRYIATRMAERAPDVRKIINCHLGGSCSVCAIEDGKSVANSFGTTPQSGVFHNNRVGEFDVFALQKLFAAGIRVDEVFRRLGEEGGLLGISGVSADCREVEKAAAEGNERAQLAVDAFVESIRHYIGAYLGVLGGADAICFTGGIGQFGSGVRAAALEGFEFAGIGVDPTLNAEADGNRESRIDNLMGTQVWVLPTNEELVVARQTVAALQAQNA